MTGFRQKYSTQNALLDMIENWKLNLNKGCKIGAILMDLSKAFDTIDHYLLLAKLKAYGFDDSALKLLKSYLSDRYQRCEIGNSYSDWSQMKTGVPQGSILGPLLFNIFINDIFYFVHSSNICNYADDNTIYSCDKNYDEVVRCLQLDFSNLKKWFYDNFLVLNPGKCHFMTLGTKNISPDFIHNGIIIKHNTSQKLLGVIIDENLNFKEHIGEVCKKANQKMNALNRISSYISPEQHKLISNAYIKSFFNYCPLVWMFCGRKEIAKINKIHERCMRLTLHNFDDSFETLLLLSGDTPIHQRCLNFLMVEVYKYLNGLSPDIMSSIFNVRENPYNIRNFNLFHTTVPHSNKFGLNTIAYRANLIWSSLPENIKGSTSLYSFKNALKSWTCDSCPCNICKQYIPNLGYL